MESQQPVDGVSFTSENEKGWFYISIGELDEITIPKPTKQQAAKEYLTLVVVHAPTCCNYWHFVFAWKLSSDGKIVSANESKWKEEIAATMRPIIMQNVVVENTENKQLPPEAYINQMAEE